MPIYEPDHVEYTITSGMISIAMEDGRQLPAYWAHPTLGSKFPGVAIAHDWWGLTSMIRRMANLFAQMGHYVIVPDLFDGRTTADPKAALELVEETKESNYRRLDDALHVMEGHHQCNKSVAAIGVGMGGSLAFEAAIVREDLEAAVAYSGFPQRYLGQFHTANTPICAFFGQGERHISSSIIKKMRDDLVKSDHEIDHEIHIIPDIEHEFFSEALNEQQRLRSRNVLKETFDFLDKYLEGPTRPGDRMLY
jgi:carboxymethylenebutenolidase